MLIGHRKSTGSPQSHKNHTASVTHSSSSTLPTQELTSDQNPPNNFHFTSLSLFLWAYSPHNHTGHSHTFALLPCSQVTSKITRHRGQSLSSHCVFHACMHVWIFVAMRKKSSRQLFLLISVGYIIAMSIDFSCSECGKAVTDDDNIYDLRIPSRWLIKLRFDWPS